MLQHPQRLIGLHFFNPVHRMQLVEVVRTDLASDEAIDTAVGFIGGSASCRSWCGIGPVFW